MHTTKSTKRAPWWKSDAEIIQYVGTLAAKAAVKGQSTDLYETILARLGA